MNMELKLDSHPESEGTVENIQLRIFIEGDKNKPVNIKIELISENDLFFNYVSITNESIFAKM